MDLDLELEEIYKAVGRYDYTKGKYYPANYIQYVDSYKEKNVNIHLFQVESERNYDEYDVQIREKNHKIIDTDCTCPQYYATGSCKHIAACLIHYQEQIFPVDPEEKKRRVSKALLEEFYTPKVKQEIMLKKQLNLFVSLEFHESYYEPSVSINLKIGEKRLYNLNNKLRRFLEAYLSNEGIVEFGKNLIYEPNKYYFSKTDETILDFFANIYERK